MKSRFSVVADQVHLPKFSGVRALLMPIIHGDPASLPDNMAQYGDLVQVMGEAKPEHLGKVVYLTVDEKLVQAGMTHRRSRLHVDGWHITEEGSKLGGPWGGGNPGGAWGGARPGEEGTGLLTVASHIGCRAWNQDFDGEPAPEGDCEHMRPQALGKNAEVLAANRLYWLGAHCVHESLRQGEDVERQFVRLSLPSTAEWYEGCTPNPKGILPTGPIAPRRRFMTKR